MVEKRGLEPLPKPIIVLFSTAYLVADMGYTQSTRKLELLDVTIYI